MTIAGTRGRRDARLHLPALRISARASRARTRRSRSATRPAISARTCSAAARRFDLEVRLGAGAYICGEETSLLETSKASAARCASSRRCRRSKGLFGKPTVINNVITFASVPIILDRGAELLPRLRHGPLARHAAVPARRQHQARRPGREGLRRDAARAALRLRRRLAFSGRPIRAVQVGGPLGAYLPESQFDTPLDYEAFAAGRRHARPRRHRRVRRHGRHGRAGALRDGVLRRSSPAASARRAASARPAASR